MAKEFFKDQESVMAPLRHAFAIVPDDVNPLTIIPREIRCNVGGTVAMRLVSSGADVAITMVAGERLAWRAQYVRATGTTATLHGAA